MKAIQLDAHRPAATRKTIKGVEFLVAVSPYFFPERLECDYDGASGIYAIRFKYLDNESSKASADDGDDLIDIEVGCRTGRVLMIRVQVDRHNLDQIRMIVVERVPKALAEISKRGARIGLEDNYRFVAEAISSHAGELLECLRPVS